MAREAGKKEKKEKDNDVTILNRKVNRQRKIAGEKADQVDL